MSNQPDVSVIYWAWYNGLIKLGSLESAVKTTGLTRDYSLSGVWFESDGPSNISLLDVFFLQMYKK